MLVQQLQSRLQAQYDLNIPYDVEHFVSHDAELARHLSGNHSNATADSIDERIEQETVFIRQSADTLEFTLYLDKDVLNQASAHGGTDHSEISSGTESHSDGDVVDNLCTIVEGVSHAVCLLWHAHHDRQLRPLDLELQAEIDKYLLLAGSRCETSQRRQWHQQLFYQVSYSALEGTTLHERYRIANDTAASYCHWLSEQFLDAADERGLSRELARFYRLSGKAKFERIKQLH